ncbi:hypothetical protein [Cesiribacter andamanensis]|uniref:Uncharacterized protein n=1 Tax=Cesiribacter andamanensis AMV16 TaxID=1279009 RepID=M7NC98_9BACT|nr:hypothetical protein [Cesiribacter andamanensis]EMR04766.1 hypothetical protein ADICEAN_00037 [Cesiribacter andamanensis AMV16]
MIEVFKTDVRQRKKAQKIIGLLLRYFPQNRINFDLEDCDRILRVEGVPIHPETIIDLLQAEGVYCRPLDEA